MTTVQQVLTFDSEEPIYVDYSDFRAAVAHLEFGDPTTEYSEGQITLNTYEYNMSRAFIVKDIPIETVQRDSWLVAIILNIVMSILVAVALIRRYLKEHTIDSKISLK